MSFDANQTIKAEIIADAPSVVNKKRKYEDVDAREGNEHKDEDVEDQDKEINYLYFP